MRLITLVLLVLTFPALAAEKNPDPWEGFNRSMFHFNEKMDDYLLRPTAVAYNKVVPSPARTALSNVFSNAGEVKTIINDVAQLKLLQAGADTVRFILNTTLGFFGVFDVATPIGLQKHNEDFGQTFGYWGVPSGPYLMLPLLGPSTVRDSAGLGVEYAADISYADLGRNGTEDLAIAVVYGVSMRAQLLNIEGMVSGDRYVFIRSFYLQHRDFLINDGNSADDFGDEDWEDFDDEIDEDLE